MSGAVLPRPGLAWGTYPQRPEPAGLPAWRVWVALVSRARVARLPRKLQRALHEATAQLRQADETARAALLARTRHALRREGLVPQALGAALALAADALGRRCGKVPYPSQLLAATLLLQGRFAEMATGEGKTLAMGLACAVAALAGAPVHLLTANDYLARRDRELLLPLYEELGLTSACIIAATPQAERAALYRCDVVHSTAREIGFDYLRDHVQHAGERDPRRLRALALGSADPAGTGAAAQPLLPGLCFALLDEADSLLLDEATTPLLLGVQGAAPDARIYYGVWRLARLLVPQQDYLLWPAQRRAELTPAGLARVAAAKARCGTQVLADLAHAALAARHLYERNRDYIVGAQGVMLIDEPTGRVAEGRRWQGPLHAMVQIKEGLAPEAGPVTAAQITYPRLFGRYLWLAGLSGTLADSAAQLHALYGVRVSRVPLAHPDRRRWQGERLFVSGAQRWQAVLGAVQREAALGRPVLVGTESVAASAELCALLACAGIAHQRLDAQQDADEAARIARAGVAGCITVATNIAGRGTDIQLDAAARAAGGLHVVVTHKHRSRRIERQLVGRCARQGDPGSAEALLALDDPLIAATWPRPVRAAAAVLVWHGVVPRWLAWPLTALAQRAQEATDAARRWQLASSERALDEALGYAGAGE